MFLLQKLENMAQERSRRHSMACIPEDIAVEQAQNNKKPEIYAMTPRRYLSKSTLHVLRYVTDRSMTWFERFDTHLLCYFVKVNIVYNIINSNALINRSLFVVAFAFLLCVVGWQIHTLQVKWSTSTSISITPKTIHVSDIPFPGMFNALSYSHYFFLITCIASTVNI